MGDTVMSDYLDNGLEAKTQGNAKFKGGEFKNAITSYTEAIDLLEDYLDANYDVEADALQDAAEEVSTAAPSEGYSPADENVEMSAADGECIDSSKSDESANRNTKSESESSVTVSKSDVSKSESTNGSNTTADSTNSKSLPSSEARPRSPEEQKLRRDIAICYSNRAFCHIKMENFGSAIVDAERAITIEPTYPKSYYRLGCSRYALFKYKDAMKAFKQLCKIAPTDKDARLKLKECEKQVQAQKFAAAIASDNTSNIEDQIRKQLEEGSITDPPSDYKGPVYEGREKMTQEWVISVMEWMKEEKLVAKKYVYMMVMDVLDLLKSHKTVEHIPMETGDEMTVCGDVHGQYYDLMNIFKLNGYPSETNPYLFNGDFVDRGSFSIEVIIALFAWKLLNPNKFFLARGNHETTSMNKLYGFEGETKKKYDQPLYYLYCHVFCHLPLCHVIADEIFVVHGGLFSQDNVKLEELQKEDRIREPPENGRIVEMLWSDPHPLNGRLPSRRGVGCQFGPNVTKNFCETNNLSMVVRSHEMKDNGYELEHSGKLITIFSAPNYCDQMKNKGAYIRWKKVKDDEDRQNFIKDADTSIKSSNKDHLKDLAYTITTFDSVPHPEKKAMSYANPMLGMMMGGM